MQHVAFIGLGNMGAPMSRHIIKAFEKVSVFDLDADALAEAKEAGARPASSIADVVRGADAVISMLPAGPHVLSVYAGEDGVFANAEAGALFMDCSTIDVETAREVGARAKEQGFAMCDAPVSGGVAAAAAGTLTFMVGGEEESFQQAKRFLDPMGKAVIYAGASGAGQAAKICNNMLLGIHMIGTCEAFALAEKLGLEAQNFFDIASVSSGQNWSLTSYCPVPGPVPAAPSNRDYQPGFAASMMLKDLRLAQHAASKANANTPMGNQAAALYALFAAQGESNTDFSGIIRFLQGKVGEQGG
jgi:3-hydroxyisobutyrate dehydrogenase